MPIRGLRDLPGWESFVEPAETGATFEENATIKARSYARQTGLPCLADDSGLEVDALGGRPGVISSHYSTDGADTGLGRAERDRLNNERLLRDLCGIPPDRRTARFVCVMVLCDPPTKPGAGGVPPLIEPGAGGVPPPPWGQRPHGLAGGARWTAHRLPHLERAAATYFLTWRLERGELSPAERAIVLGACLHWHGIKAWFHYGVVMHDHVHVLMQLIDDAAPRPILAGIIHSIKSFTSHEINTLRGGTGKIWQDDYFDEAFSLGVPQQTIDYIENNPRKAGLVAPGERYLFSWRPGGHGLVVLGSGEVRPPRTSERGVSGPPSGAGRPRLRVARGAFEGRIGLPGDVPRGGNGFGYDPLFLVAPAFVRTSAELSPDEKNRLSHRGLAAREMARLLAT